MAVTYENAPEVEKIAIELIQKHHTHLVEAKIKYLFRDGKWSTKNRDTWGQAQKVTGQMKFITGYDLIVLIHSVVWRRLEEFQRVALVDHELCHFSPGEYDDDGNPTWTIEGHDVEEFNSIIRRHGLWSPSLKQLETAAKESNQLNIFDYMGSKTIEQRNAEMNGQAAGNVIRFLRKDH